MHVSVQVACVRGASEQRYRIPVCVYWERCILGGRVTIPYRLGIF